MRRITYSGRTDRQLQKLWRQVEANLDRPWTPDQLARVAHMSPAHLRRLCKAELGHSPTDRLIQLRMRRAATLLHRGHAAVKTIAAQVGYANEFAFSAAFKRIMGTSPTAFRLMENATDRTRA